MFRPKKVVGLLWANGTQIDLGQPRIEESAPTFTPALSDKEPRWQCNSHTVLHKFMVSESAKLLVWSS